MRRHATGIIALLLVLGGGACWLWAPQDSAGWLQFEAACLRMGALMAVVWMAYPEVQRIPSWMIPILLVAVAVLLWRPRVVLALIRLAPLAVPIAIALILLRPRFRRRM